MQDVLALLADGVPNPGAKTPKGLTGPRDTLLGILKWGGFAIAAGSFIYTGIRMQLGSQGGRGATTAADAVAELPMKVLGTLFIGGVGAGILGMFL
ncbi:hypothetical protein DVA86_20370 [Streptomyces armeniacus]|uniref:Uncharacterized protein n=1 Tax=Streptomyces armeniacus TaxID=83291 RepID=A0A345XSN5_9ACTN|nr:hypothetical protein [Streptomyces armeniacus]AXK34651.1 hypothetical protein DVA86_20370 [Streptomyces armeniacus]